MPPLCIIVCSDAFILDESGDSDVPLFKSERAHRHMPWQLFCMHAMKLSVLLVVQAAAYYLGMLAYYWVLATPSVGFLFGCYLYLSVNWFHVHYDEAFSSLQIPHHKGFSRLHITPDGDMHIYGLAMDQASFKGHPCCSACFPGHQMAH